MPGFLAAGATYLVIAATAATELFGLTRSGAAFTAAMLSIGGYDVLKLIEARWLRRVGLVDDPSCRPRGARESPSPPEQPRGRNGSKNTPAIRRRAVS